MSALALDYRHCSRKRPKFIKHTEIEGIATQARQQLISPQAEAMPFDVLRGVNRLNINGVDFSLEISTDFDVHDEEGRHVFGICEYDPGVPDMAMVCVSPVGEKLSEMLTLSTLAHELGHAVFDAPGWIVDGSKGPGLFDAFEPTVRRAYRTTTPDSEHLTKTPQQSARDQEIRFAEMRANEFMGSLLVPRRHLSAAVQELAPELGIALGYGPSLDPEVPGAHVYVAGDGEGELESLERELAVRFGVNRRFVQVCLLRYGLIRMQPPAR